MQIWLEIRRRLRAMLAPFLWLMLTFYFGYHAVHGERGLIRMAALRQKIQEASSGADAVARQRAEMEERVRQLSPQSIDTDMLEESARSMLNMAQDGDYVIYDTTE